jgi:2-dehydro-3-deoxyphosphogluconate aldolase/(4S)-4-hydroxy-2-oxoglutarate aldolase
MNKAEILKKILEVKIVAILRSDDPAKILPSAKAILKGGIRAIEVSLNTPNAIECITEISRIEGILPGVGTVTDVEMTKKAIEAGAQFVVTPISKKEVIKVCHELDKPIFSGAFTPKEIYEAYEWGADIVKVFPAEILGPNYIKTIKTPFPKIKLMPTGGVNSNNIDQWFEMGADCVGIGGCFTRASIMKNEEWDRQTERAEYLVNNIMHYLEARHD